ncbi:hypothetical protein Clacol_004178 [Clathrus columnatus]|uniref:Uncharacterized protein n=1 Tax=Clathrus columnatus TaxID=1419009 RepID=A0AAV5AB62_9AGAM|nr:hypothetical protein Clacol_004178 [Clathrus columnatus]
MPVRSVLVGAPRTQSERITWAIKNRRVFEEEEGFDIVPKVITEDDDDEDIENYQKQYDKRIKNKRMELKKKREEEEGLEAKEKDEMMKLKEMFPAIAAKLSKLNSLSSLTQTTPAVMSVDVASSSNTKWTTTPKRPIVIEDYFSGNSAPKKTRTTINELLLEKGPIIVEACDRCDRKGVLFCVSEKGVGARERESSDDDEEKEGFKDFDPPSSKNPDNERCFEYDEANRTVTVNISESGKNRRFVGLDIRSPK